MTDFLKERHDALTRTLNENIQHILRVGHWDFRIMEQEFKQQGYRDDYDSGVERILIFRWDNVGDFILMTPAIRELRANYPNAFITLLVDKASYQMAEFCPYVNEVIYFESKTAEFWRTQDYMGMLKNAANFAVQYLWKRNYTVCICFTNIISLQDLFFNYLSGAKERVGYVANLKFLYEESSKWNPRYDIANQFLTRSVIPPKEILTICAKDLYILKAMGLQVHETDCELWYGSEDLYVAQKLLKDFMPDGFKIVIGVGASLPSRKYPLEKYLVVFNEILSKSENEIGLIIVGGPSEVDDAKFIEENLPEENVINLAGKISWRVLAAVMSLSDMYLGNDTGTLHIAAAAHLPIINMRKEAKSREQSPVFMGTSSEYTRYFPWQTNSILLRPGRPLPECEKTVQGKGGCIVDKPHCITQIEPQEIIDAYNTMIKFLRHSGIKRSSCPPVIRSINQVPKLYSNIVDP